jgi:hypothetical protein
MSWTVREANPHLERDTLVQVLKSYLAPDINPNRFDWLNFANPHGSARIWVLEENGEPVGTGAAIPRKLRIEGAGAASVGCVFGDFCVAPNLRSIGPALQLQRACLRAVDDGWARVAYDLPSVSMMAVYRRLRIPQLGSLVRMAKPLRINRQIGERARSNALAAFVTHAGNMALKLRDRLKSASPELETQKYEEPFEREFTELFEQVAKNESWCVERSAEYLNWRFRAHPTTQYGAWVSRRNGRLEGYAITRNNRQDVQIVELCCTDSAEVLESLILTVTDSARAQGAATLSMPILAGSRRAQQLEHLGFRARESTPVLTYGAGSWTQSAAWFGEGDRES